MHVCASESGGETINQESLKEALDIYIPDLPSRFSAMEFQF
jgi:hypothetical protein